MSNKPISVTTELPPYCDGVNLSLKELIYYKQQSIHWLPPAKSLWSQLLGQHQSRQLGRGMDFSEVRQYQAGDDIRAIDWRVTARTGKPHTKLFSEEREKPVVLYIDLSPSMLFGSKLMLKSVLMCHMASLIAWLSVANQDRVGALIHCGHKMVELKPTARDKGVLAILQSLVTLHKELLVHRESASLEQSNERLEPAFGALSRMCPKGSEVILLSDFAHLTPKHKPLLSRISQHNRVRLVQVSDPLEKGVTQYRGTEQVTDQRQSRWLDFSSKKTRSGLEKAHYNQQQQLKQLAQSLGMSFSNLSSDAALTTQLHGTK